VQERALAQSGSLPCENDEPLDSKDSGDVYLVSIRKIIEKGDET
jgi:hypothetical protein